MATEQAAARSSGDLTANRGRQIYRQITGRKYLIMAGLVATLCGTLILDISLGPARLGLAEVISTILRPGSAEVSTRVIVWDIRMPIALMAIAVGAALSIAGAEMQTILNNPLASPFTLGISAAAGFGAALALVLGLQRRSLRRCVSGFGQRLCFRDGGLNDHLRSQQLEGRNHLKQWCSWGSPWFSFSAPC